MNRYFVYETVCLINNKTYIGSTSSINKEYLGSGIKLKKDINKYGLKQFSKKILHECNNIYEALDIESQLVTKNYVKSSETYNLISGGGIGWSAVNVKRKNIYTRTKKHRNESSIKARKYLHNKSVRKKSSNTFKKRYKEGKINLIGFKNKKHSNKTKEIIGRKSAIHQKGKGNSQYGKPRSEKTKRKISETLKKRKKVFTT